MEREDVFLKVSDIIRKVLLSKNLKIDLENSLADDLGMDSLGAVEMVNMVEDEFNISITEDEMQSIKTVNDAVNLILEKASHT